MTELQQLATSALAHPADQEAIEFEGEWISWGEITRLAQQVSTLLATSGVQPGAKIALIARNHPSAMAAFLGLIASAYSIRMIYPFQSATGLTREIDLGSPAAVICAEQDFSDTLRETLQSRSIAGLLLREDMHALLAPGCDKSLINSDKPAPPEIEILTSGTTGKPKPFRLSYAIVAKDFISANSAPIHTAINDAEQAPVLLFFPLGNISGLYSTLPALLGGRRIVLLERFSLAGWHDYVRRYRPLVGGLPPAGIRMALDANLPREDLASLRMIGAGAAPLDPATQRAFEQRYGIPILLSYGATEFGGPVARMTPELHAAWGEQKLGSVGQVIPGVTLKVVDPESGRELDAGQEGLLEIKTPRIGDKWIKTTDIGLLDEDGFLYLRGRADGAIIRGGFKILPETIERALLLHPAVSAAAVVGIADDRLGQVPAAAVVLKPDAEADSDELSRHLREHVLATHIPTAWVFVDELPRTRLSYKVDQAAVRELFAPPG